MQDNQTPQTPVSHLHKFKVGETVYRAYNYSFGHDDPPNILVGEYTITEVKTKNVDNLCLEVYNMVNTKGSPELVERYSWDIFKTKEEALASFKTKLETEISELDEKLKPLYRDREIAITALKAINEKELFNKYYF